MFCQKCGSEDNGGINCGFCGGKDFGPVRPELPEDQDAEKITEKLEEEQKKADEFGESCMAWVIGIFIVVVIGFFMFS